MVKRQIGLINDNGIWSSTRHSNELYVVCCARCNELDIVTVTKIGRMRWLGHLCRMQEMDPCGKLTLTKPEDPRRLGKPKLRWIALVEEDLKKMAVRNWRRMSQDRDQRRTILGEAEVPRGL